MPLFIVFYLGLLVTINGLTVLRWNFLSKADKQIAILILITTLDELVAYLVQQSHQNNLVVYHAYSPLELLCISLYFNESIILFKRYGIGIIVAILGFAFAIFNAIFLQKTSTMNFNFLLLEGAVINVYCLFAFRQIALGGIDKLQRLAQFWITSSLLLYWSLTFTGWGITAIAGQQTNSVFGVFYKVLTTVNFLFYITIALVFCFYKKLIPSRSEKI